MIIAIFRTTKRILSMLLLVLYLAGFGKIYTPIISYKINFKYISEVLCVNKQVPVSKCQGKCYLNKKLMEGAKEQSKEKRAGRTVQDEIVINYFCISDYLPSLLYQIAHSFSNHPIYNFSPERFSPPPQV